MRELAVLHVLNELRPSGAERMLLAAAGEWARHGVRCEIVSNGESPGTFADALKHAGYPVHHLPLTSSPLSVLRLARLIRGRCYDAVHVHTERANFSIGLTCRLACKGPVIRTIHNNFPYPGLLRLVRRVQRRALALLGVRHVAISRGVQETERQWLGNLAALIANWYDDAQFLPPPDAARRRARAHFGIERDEFVIVTVGNCSAIKNHSALFEALAILKADLRPRYLHAGVEESGKPEQELAARLGVAGQVIFAGQLADPREALYAADAFVQPSLREGFSIAALEALAVGLPAVLFDAPGLRDLRDTFPALIFVAADARSLASGLRRVVAEAEALSSRARADYPRIAREHFGISRGVSAYVELYRRRSRWSS
jgi:glycosyltransferase involved in cell wall biosynthesis